MNTLRRHFLKWAAYGVAGALALGYASQFGFAQEKTPPQSRPNILIFFIDDLGWADVGYNGSTFYETPNPHFSSIPRNGVGGARGMGFHGFEAASPLGGVAVRQKRPRMPSADMAGAFLICFWANLDCRPCRALCASSIT